MEQSFYNARLRTVTDTEAVYEWEEKTVFVPTPAHAERLVQQIGQIGLLMIDEEGGEPGFFTPTWSNDYDVSGSTTVRISGPGNLTAQKN